MPDKDLDHLDAGSLRPDENNPTEPQGLPGQSLKLGGPQPPAAAGAQAAKGERGKRQDGQPTREEKAEANSALWQSIQAQELQAVQERERAPVPLGRPSSYTEEAGHSICVWIAEGRSLKSYCAVHGMAIDTVYRWLRSRADFRELYTQAHEDRADTLADEMIEIADAAQHASIEGVQAAKLRVETRKWIAQKMRPQKYGDRQEVVHQGGVSIRIGIPQRPIQASEVVERLDDQQRIEATPRQH